jgi:hypothetical protein
MEGVTHVDMPDRPSLLLFEVRRRGRGPLLVVWEQRDPFHGDDEPPVAFDWAWPAARATAVDALGQAPLRRRPPPSCVDCC